MFSPHNVNPELRGLVDSELESGQHSLHVLQSIIK